MPGKECKVASILKKLHFEEQKEKKKRLHTAQAYCWRLVSSEEQNLKALRRIKRCFFIITYYTKFIELESINERKIGEKMIEKTSVIGFNRMK